MKLLVSGCSITHGAELHNNFMHPENVKKSYSQHLANKLDLELLNVALSAGSNEYIFHSTVEKIQKNNDIDSVLVMWTTTGRLHWKCNNRHYFISGNFASSMIDLVNFKMHDKTVDGCWFTGDNDDIVNKLAETHKFFVTDYFDSNEELSKLKNYSMTLQALCNQKKIKLVELTWKDIDQIGTWQSEGRHPNTIEHKDIADMVYKEYYENKF
jgi:hypothetical protein